MVWPPWPGHSLHASSQARQPMQRFGSMKSSPVNQYPSLTLTGSLSIRTAATLNSGMPAIGS